MHNGEDGPSATPARYGYCSVPACLMLHVSPFRSEDAMSLQPDQRGAVVCRTENGLSLDAGMRSAISRARQDLRGERRTFRRGNQVIVPWR
jgi:hypothetical protein